MSTTLVARTTATSTTPAPVPILSPNAALIARRFSFGIKPGLTRDIFAAGNGRRWFDQQLDPDSVPDPGGDEVDSWFPYLGRTSEEIYQRQRSGEEGSWEVMADLSRRTVARRLRSRHQLHEVMVDFWSNLLHVPLGTDTAAFARADYDRVIRANALTSFEQLLQRAITHPAMGINLNNNVSTKYAPNENLGRELLELHTVGFGAGYSEADVKASAKILTGYRVDLWPAFKAYYDPKLHWTGALSVMDFQAANADADGQNTTMAYLAYLARHPKTAQRIARRLCVRFVRDDPSAALVDAVATAYSANDTAIKPTLAALVDHPEFKTSAGLKLRTPQEDWQAMVRALGIKVLRPTKGSSFVNSMLWQYKELGAAPYEWAAPNGYPEVNAAWSSAGRMLNSFSVHQTMSAHWWPRDDAVIPELDRLVPSTPMTLQNLVNAYGLRILGELPKANVCRSVSTVLGWPLSHVVTTQEAGYYWTRASIVATLFDSPQHMYR